MDVLTHLQSALADRYRLLREIGQGGMATVYLARDLRHDRPVALKVLRPELGAVLGVERFLSEIRVTANLQHPNLLPLFDSGASDGVLFYVMPFVEGESLRHRLDREKQLPVDEAVRITAAVGSALDYAHRHGVVHRDLKPENVLLHEGQPLVADFGIALAVSNAGGARVTQTGLSLGTPQYMSPEQATGDRQIDARSDIYSLAAVMYEMLVGEPPHTGPTIQAVIARVLTDVPRAVRVARPAVPRHVEAAIAKALEKLPADRFATAAHFVETLQHPGSASSRPGDAPSDGLDATGDVPATRGRDRRSRWRALAPWVGGALVGGGIATAAIMLRPVTPPPTIRFSFPIKASPGCIAVSPDGSRIVYEGGTTTTQLHARTLGDDIARPLAGTEGSQGCFFSPDGDWLGFWSDGRLQKIPVTGGAAITIANVERYAGATWGKHDDIVFATGLGGLWHVRAAGGTPRQFTLNDSTPGATSHRHPYFLPDGRTVLFTSWASGLSLRLGIASLDGRTTVLDQQGSSPWYLEGDRVLFTSRDGTSLIASFDPRRRVLTSTPVAVIQEVDARANGSVALSVSSSGTLAYMRGRPPSVFVLVGPDGQQQTLPVPPRRMRHVRLSPDGGRIAVEVLTAAPAGSSDVWSYDIASRTFTRLTFDGRSADPIWTRDGKRVAFVRYDPGSAGADAYWVAADGSGAPELLLGGPGGQWPTGFTADGRTVVFDEMLPARLQMHVSAVTIGGSDRRVVVESQFSNRLAALSPDGRWLAYTTNETGRTDVFVRPFPLTGGRWQISTDGGSEPVWSRDGRALYYRDGGHVVAADVRTTPSFAVIARRAIADDRFVTDNGTNIDAAPNDRVLALKPAESVTQLNVVVNWLAEIDQRLRTKP